MTHAMRLNLGSGRRPVNGAEWVNVDNRESVDPDQVVDLDAFPWPWKDDRVVEIRAWHLLEHVEDVVGFMNEAHRVLVPSGVLRVRVPHFRHPNAYTDPTHKRFFTPDSLDYFCDRELSVIPVRQDIEAYGEGRWRKERVEVQGPVPPWGSRKALKRWLLGRVPPPGEIRFRLRAIK